MDIKDLFIRLTQYLIPYQQEWRLESFFPNGIKKDEVGNYYIIIGETKTMFTCHLDNYTKKIHNVNHVFYENGTNEMVRTDEKTPLGSDDKAGMVVMLNMIEHNVPGCYYFFIGEECGSVGSNGILNVKRDWFTQFDRCIAFDRRGYGSIISKQHNNICCSKEFVDSLSKEFGKNGLLYRDDPTGVHTDSAVFMYTIPEVSNLSCGGFNEHTVMEYQNLSYLERVCNATIKIDWENLPVVRYPEKGIISHFKSFVSKKNRNKNIENNKASLHVDKSRSMSRSELSEEMDKYRERVRNKKYIK